MGDDLPVVDDGDPITKRFGDLQRVRRQEHRTTVPCEGAEQVFEQPSRPRVEAHHRLIDDNQLRLVNQSRADQDLLTHTVRVALDQFVLPRCELKKLEKAVRPRFDFLALSAP